MHVGEAIRYSVPLAAAALVVLAGCGSTARPPAPPSPVHYTYPPVASVSAVPATTVLPGAAVSPLQSWWDNGGSTDWTTVEGDLSQIQTDSSNGDLASVEADGGQLRTDALAAVKDHAPYSADKHAYDFGAMAGMAFAGLELQFGNLAKATALMKTANADITKFQAEAKAEGLVVS